jgi:Cu-processing system permease protein
MIEASMPRALAAAAGEPHDESPALSTWALMRLCAAQERQLAARTRSTQLFAGVFAVIALGVASSGYILSGGSGVQDFSRTTVSLVQLVLLVIPLTALTTGVLALTLERGHAEILFSQPVSRAVILAGKLLGLFQALAAAQAIGFGAAGLAIAVQAGDEDSGAFLWLLGAGLVLTAIFLGIAALIAAGDVAGRRARSLAVALVVWFGMVVVYDVGALGVASMLPSTIASRLLIAAVIVNPVDAVRTGTLLAVEGTAAFGAASLAFLRVAHGPAGAAVLIGASIVLWATVPILWAVRRLNRADI